jgi:hypothetical protein
LEETRVRDRAQVDQSASIPHDTPQLPLCPGRGSGILPPSNVYGHCDAFSGCLLLELGYLQYARDAALRHVHRLVLPCRDSLHLFGRYHGKWPLRRRLEAGCPGVCEWHAVLRSLYVHPRVIFGIFQRPGMQCVRRTRRRQQATLCEIVKTSTPLQAAARHQGHAALGIARRLGAGGHRRFPAYLYTHAS